MRWWIAACSHDVPLSNSSYWAGSFSGLSTHWPQSGHCVHETVGNWLSRTMGTMSWSRFHGLSHGILHLSQSSSHAQASERERDKGPLSYTFAGNTLVWVWGHYCLCITISEVLGNLQAAFIYFIVTGKLVLSPYRQRKRLSTEEISSELWSEDFKYQNAYMFASKYPCSLSVVQQASEMLKIRNFLRTSSILQVGNSTPNFMWLATVKKCSVSLPSFQPLFCKVCVEHKWSWCLDLNRISKISYICLWHSKVWKRKKNLFWFWAFG